jgi:hypothetical protein
MKICFLELCECFFAKVFVILKPFDGGAKEIGCQGFIHTIVVYDSKLQQIHARRRLEEGQKKLDFEA